MNWTQHQVEKASGSEQRQPIHGFSSMLGSLVEGSYRKGEILRRALLSPSRRRPDFAALCDVLTCS